MDLRKIRTEALLVLGKHDISGLEKLNLQREDINCIFTSSVINSNRNNLLYLRDKMNFTKQEAQKINPLLSVQNADMLRCLALDYNFTKDDISLDVLKLSLRDPDRFQIFYTYYGLRRQDIHEIYDYAKSNNFVEVVKKIDEIFIE